MVFLSFTMTAFAQQPVAPPKPVGSFSAQRGPRATLPEESSVVISTLPAEPPIASHELDSSSGLDNLDALGELEPGEPGEMLLPTLDISPPP